MSQYHLFPGQPSRFTLNKGILSPPYSPAPVPHSVSQSHYCSISLAVPLMPLSRKPHFCSYRSPSVDVNTSIPKDRPKGPCILVASTSLMSSLDHLKGVLSAFWVGCVSFSRLHLHYCTIKIHTGYWFLHYLVKDPCCHLKLGHW